MGSENLTPFGLETEFWGEFRGEGFSGVAAERVSIGSGVSGDPLRPPGQNSSLPPLSSTPRPPKEWDIFEAQKWDIFSAH